MYEQIIYFGAPGTGKSFLIDQKLRENSILPAKIFRVVIHPEYSYSDFVGQLIPTNLQRDNGKNELTFTFKEGPFTRALIEAYKDLSKDVYLIIEELSRGNAAAIFGDLFQLLDRNEHFESRYSINNKEIADRLTTEIGDNIKLPSNFNILCTVNTTDQNVFPLDTAFKRRFEWEYVSTKPIIQEETNETDYNKNNPIIFLFKQDELIKSNWLTFYMGLNRFIINKMRKNEDRQVGQFFLEFKDNLIKNSLFDDAEVQQKTKLRINKIIKNKLLLYLWQDVQGCYSINSNNSLFNNNIKSFEELYDKYDKMQVFSNEFFEEFEKIKYNDPSFE